MSHEDFLTRNIRRHRGFPWRISRIIVVALALLASQLEVCVANSGGFKAIFSEAKSLKTVEVPYVSTEYGNASQKSADTSLPTAPYSLQKPNELITPFDSLDNYTIHRRALSKGSSSYSPYDPSKYLQSMQQLVEEIVMQVNTRNTDYANSWFRCRMELSTGVTCSCSTEKVYRGSKPFGLADYNLVDLWGAIRTQPYIKATLQTAINQREVNPRPDLQALSVCPFMFRKENFFQGFQHDCICFRK